jgi:V/A-type H+-transporting ATPase subunit A
LIAKGVTLVKFKRMKVIGEIARMRLTVANDNLEELDKIELRLERSMNQIGGIYEQR